MAVKKMLDQRDSAHAVQTETMQTLPKMGALCPQWKRCGKMNCRCAAGTLHGPYYCFFWRERGRLRKRYVALRDVEGSARRASGTSRDALAATLGRQRVAEVMAGADGQHAGVRAMDQEIARREAAAVTGEGVGLAHEMVRAYAEQVAFLRKHMRLTVEEALAQIDNPRDAAAQRERLMRSPPDQVFWLDLAQLLERDPEGAQVAWDRLKAEARAELAGGHRAAKAVEYRTGPGNGPASWRCASRSATSGSRGEGSRTR